MSSDGGVSEGTAATEANIRRRRATSRSVAQRLDPAAINVAELTTPGMWPTEKTNAARRIATLIRSRSRRTEGMVVPEVCVMRDPFVEEGTAGARSGQLPVR